MGHSNQEPYKTILPNEGSVSERGRFRDFVFLTQTDTTLGFVSQDAKKLNQIKQRPSCKHFIKALPSLEQLKLYTRTPQIHKNTLRRAKKSTFVFPDGNSYRIVREEKHRGLIAKLGWAYTTSANLSGEAYDAIFATESADVIVGFPMKKRDQKASAIFKISTTNIKRIR